MALKNIALSVFLLTSLVVTIYALPPGTVGNIPEPKAALVPEGKIHDAEPGKLVIRHLTEEQCVPPGC